jgi:hypothetical protein
MCLIHCFFVFYIDTIARDKLAAPAFCPGIRRSDEIPNAREPPLSERGRLVSVLFGSTHLTYLRNVSAKKRFATLPQRKSGRQFAPVGRAARDDLGI